MGFDRVAAVFAATLSHFSTSSSTSGSFLSTAPLPPSSSPFSSAWASYGRAGGLHLSSSLQDFSTYRKVEPGISLGIDAGFLETKFSPFHIPSEGAGGSTSFSKEKAFPLAPPRNRRLLKIAAGFSLIFLLLTLFLFRSGWARSYWAPELSNFSVMLDCGSTGTRVHVYKWLHNNGEDRENIPMLLHSIPQGTDRKSGWQKGRAYHRMETEPGIHKLLHNESGLRAALDPLLQWAAQQIPPHAQRNTPLFLLATAGLRRLPASDAEWVLDKAWSILEKSSFMCQRSWVKIISGVEEAYYGWVALNYNMKTFAKVPRKATFGALDLGGSSLQVTFESGIMGQSEYDLNLSIGSMEHHIHAYSLAGYGLNDAFEKSIVLQLKRPSKDGNRKMVASNGQLQLKHPCLHAGYKQQYTCSQCSLQPHGRSLQNGGSSVGKERYSVEIELIGDPNWAECQALAKSVVNASEWPLSTVNTNCKQYPCAWNKHQPQSHGKFYALSGFFVVYKFFDLTSAAALDVVLEKGQHFCSKNWQEAERSVVPQPFIEQYCFRAPYMVALLRDGLHLKDEQIVVGSGSITWSLGAALLEAGALMSSRIGVGRQGRHRLDITKGGYFYLDATTFTVVLFMLLLLAICAVSCIRKLILQLWHKPHLPLFGQHTVGSSSALKLSLPFHFQIRNPISNGSGACRTGDGRVKTPLSPTTPGSQQPFRLGQTLGGNSMQLVDSMAHQSPTLAGLSFLASGLGQMQNDIGALRTPHRGQARLQSRRSQSREDLSLSISEGHIVKA
eukprot:Gb_19471 [translate_table: standard]